MTQYRSMPSVRAIREYWAPVLARIGKYDSVTEALDPTCFACGFDTVPGCRGLERAHILSRVSGGADTVDNLHMLCPMCHKASEFLTGEPYWIWLSERTIVDRCFQVAAAHGYSFTKLMFPSAIKGGG